MYYKMNSRFKINDGVRRYLSYTFIILLQNKLNNNIDVCLNVDLYEENTLHLKKLLRKKIYIHFFLEGVSIDRP